MFIAEESEKVFKAPKKRNVFQQPGVTLLRSSKLAGCSGSINISSLRDLGSSTSKRELYLLSELWRQFASW